MTHEHRWPYDDPAKPCYCTEIGEHVCIRAVGIYGRDGVGGFIIAHDLPDGGARCEGHVTVVATDDRDEVWTMTGTFEGGDLTLSPSILCTEHGWFHAHVTDGRWTG